MLIILIISILIFFIIVYNFKNQLKDFYLNNKIIPILDRRLYDILVKSYFGGHVDCYIPESNPQFTLEQIIQFINNNETDSLETVKHYDINSLYPSVMKNYQYPTDIIGHFIGDISLINNLNNI